jgi:hypothetical protein
MRHSPISYDRVNYIAVGGTGILLLGLPLLAAQPWAWPGLVAASFVAMLGLVVLWQRDPLSKRQILWGALLLRLACLPLLPGLSDDFYRYIWDGWLQIEGINPYQFRPENESLSSYQSTLIYERLNSQSYYSIYPPLTQITFALGGWCYPYGWTVSYYVTKGLFTAAEFGGVVLLSRLASARNLLLYAWNPLVLMEVAGQGHSEALLLPFIVAMVWAVKRGMGRLASLAAAGAALIKIYPVVLGPFLLRRYGWKAVWPGTVLAIVVCLPYAAPYALPHLKASVDLFAELMEFNAGFYYLTKYVFWLVTGADWSKQIGPAFRYLFLASLPVLYYLDWRRNWSFRWAILLTIGLFLVLSTTVHPWYFVPVLALGTMDKHPAWPWFWVSTCSIGTYLFYIDGPYWLWVNLGWGGAAVLGAWWYRDELKAVGAEVRTAIEKNVASGLGFQDAASDA